MKINWMVRIKNKTFWLAMIPTLLLLVKQVCGLFGVELDIAWLSEQLKEIVVTVFIILALLGVVTDPTTKGVSDSQNAMTYTVPKDDTKSEVE